MDIKKDVKLRREIIIHTRIKARTGRKKRHSAKEEQNILDQNKNYSLNYIIENSVIQ